MLVTFPIQDVDISMEGVTKWNGYKFRHRLHTFSRLS
jgi:hypothetical protein